MEKSLNIFAIENTWIPAFAGMTAVNPVTTQLFCGKQFTPNIPNGKISAFHPSSSPGSSFGYSEQPRAAKGHEPNGTGRNEALADSQGKLSRHKRHQRAEKHPGDRPGPGQPGGELE